MHSFADISDLMPSVKELIPYDYKHIRCAKYDKIIKQFLNHCKKERIFEQVSGAPEPAKQLSVNNLTMKSF